MPEHADACRPVTLPSGEPIRVRGARPMDARETAALGVLVDAARALHAAGHPPNPAAEALWARLDAAAGAAGIRRHQVARECGVRPSVVTRIAQGCMPEAGDLAAIERWLAAEPPG
jgi:hypothetical protein